MVNPPDDAIYFTRVTNFTDIKDNFFRVSMFVGAGYYF